MTDDQAVPPPVEGSWRCSECKDWRHLMAWAAAVVEGPLGPDGHLTEYHDVDDCYVHEDSIHCTEHMGERIESFRRGQWHYWWTCPRCKGGGKITDSSGGYPQEWRCPEGRKPHDGDIVWVGENTRIHGEWRPVADQHDGDDGG